MSSQKLLFLQQGQILSFNLDFKAWVNYVEVQSFLNNAVARDTKNRINNGFLFCISCKLLLCSYFSWFHWSFNVSFRGKRSVNSITTIFKTKDTQIMQLFSALNT